MSHPFLPILAKQFTYYGVTLNGYTDVPVVPPKEFEQPGDLMEAIKAVRMEAIKFWEAYMDGKLSYIVPFPEATLQYIFKGTSVSTSTTDELGAWTAWDGPQTAKGNIGDESSEWQYSIQLTELRFPASFTRTSKYSGFGDSLGQTFAWAGTDTGISRTDEFQTVSTFSIIGPPGQSYGLPILGRYPKRIKLGTVGEKQAASTFAFARYKARTPYVADTELTAPGLFSSAFDSLIPFRLEAQVNVEDSPGVLVNAVLELPSLNGTLAYSHARVWEVGVWEGPVNDPSKTPAIVWTTKGTELLPHEMVFQAGPQKYMPLPTYAAPVVSWGEATLVDVGDLKTVKVRLSERLDVNIILPHPETGWIKREPAQHDRDLFALAYQEQKDGAWVWKHYNAFAREGNLVQLEFTEPLPAGVQPNVKFVSVLSTGFLKRVEPKNLPDVTTVSVGSGGVSRWFPGDDDEWRSGIYTSVSGPRKDEITDYKRRYRNLFVDRSEILQQGYTVFDYALPVGVPSLAEGESPSAAELVELPDIIVQGVMPMVDAYDNVVHWGFMRPFGELKPVDTSLVEVYAVSPAYIFKKRGFFDPQRLDLWERYNLFDTYALSKAFAELYCAGERTCVKVINAYACMYVTADYSLKEDDVVTTTHVKDWRDGNFVRTYSFGRDGYLESNNYSRQPTNKVFRDATTGIKEHLAWLCTDSVIDGRTYSDVVCSNKLAYGYTTGSYVPVVGNRDDFKSWPGVAGRTMVELKLIDPIDNSVSYQLLGPNHAMSALSNGGLVNTTSQVTSKPVLLARIKHDGDYVFWDFKAKQDATVEFLPTAVIRAPMLGHRIKPYKTEGEFKLVTSAGDPVVASYPNVDRTPGMLVYEADSDIEYSEQLIVSASAIPKLLEIDLPEVKVHFLGTHYYNQNISLSIYAPYGLRRSVSDGGTYGYADVEFELNSGAAAQNDSPDFWPLPKNPSFTGTPPTFSFQEDLGIFSTEGTAVARYNYDASLDGFFRTTFTPPQLISLDNDNNGDGVTDLDEWPQRTQPVYGHRTALRTVVDGDKAATVIGFTASNSVSVRGSSIYLDPFNYEFNSSMLSSELVGGISELLLYGHLHGTFNYGSEIQHPLWTAGSNEDYAGFTMTLSSVGATASDQQVIMTPFWDTGTLEDPVGDIKKNIAFDGLPETAAWAIPPWSATGPWIKPPTSWKVTHANPGVYTLPHLLHTLDYKRAFSASGYWLPALQNSVFDMFANGLTATGVPADIRLLVPVYTPDDIVSIIYNGPGSVPEKNAVWQANPSVTELVGVQNDIIRLKTKAAGLNVVYVRDSLGNVLSSMFIVGREDVALRSDPSTNTTSIPNLLPGVVGQSFASGLPGIGEEISLQISSTTNSANENIFETKRRLSKLRVASPTSVAADVYDEKVWVAKARTPDASRNTSLKLRTCSVDYPHELEAVLILNYTAKFDVTAPFVMRGQPRIAATKVVSSSQTTFSVLDSDISAAGYDPNAQYFFYVYDPITGDAAVSKKV